MLRHYAAKRMLPQRRTELYLAQISMWLVRVMGGNKDAVMTDFMFDPPDDTPPTPEEEAAFFGVVLRKKKESP